MLFLLWCERVVFGLFVGSLGVWVPFRHALIAAVGAQLNGGFKAQTRGFEQSKIVNRARRKSRGHDTPVALFYDDLGFESVAILLAGVESRLFFFP